MGPRRLGAGVLSLLISWNFLLLTACERAPREPESISNEAVAPKELAPAQKSTEASPASPAPPLAEPPCINALADPPPPTASSAASCPEDPEGRPTMPSVTISFPEAGEAPTLNAEFAMTDAHRTHGLMYRPSLGDDEAMLFSWTEERPRSFWMRNTCLALDMLFVSQDGTIVGILEQVPPMNESSRSIPCPAAHVLEVRAGWTRQYGVRPGQRLAISQ